MAASPPLIIKLQTLDEPVAEVFTKTPQLFRLVTAFCSVLNAKLAPTVSSAPPAGLTKIE
jgi:hypothetical protein